MRGFRTRLAGVGLALLALATLLATSFWHVHPEHSDSSLGDSAGQKLECRLPFSALAQVSDCPPLEPDHLQCGVCLAANSASAGVLPAPPSIIIPAVFQATAYHTLTAATGTGVVALPFYARGPPLA